MNAAATADRYSRLMDAAAETVMLSRPNVTGTFGPVRARVMSFVTDDVVMDIQQGNRKVILHADDVAASGLPLPLRKTDTLTWNGKALRIIEVDDATRRLQGVLIAYELVVAGA